MRWIVACTAAAMLFALPAYAQKTVFAPDPPAGSPPIAIDAASKAIQAFLHAQCNLWEATGKTSEVEANKLVQEAIGELKVSASEFDNVASKLDPKLSIKQVNSDEFRKSYDIIVRLGRDKPDSYVSLFRTLSYTINLEIDALKGVVFEGNTNSYTAVGLRLNEVTVNTGAIYVAASVLARSGR